MFRSYIPGTMYFTGFPVIFNCPISMPFQLHPPNYILRENSFCFLKFLVSYFSNLGNSHFPFGGYWGIKFFPQNYSTMAQSSDFHLFHIKSGICLPFLRFRRTELLKLLLHFLIQYMSVNIQSDTDTGMP